jgi:hypothetical protein
VSLDWSKRKRSPTRCGYNHSMWLDADVIEFIKAYAAKNERSFSWTAQMLVKRGLKHVKQLSAHGELP